MKKQRIVILFLLGFGLWWIFRRRQSVTVALPRYRLKSNAPAYVVSKDIFSDWQPNFSRVVKQYKAGEEIGNGVGYFTTFNAQNKRFVFIVFEVPFAFNTTVFVCIEESKLILE